MAMKIGPMRWAWGLCGLMLATAGTGCMGSKPFRAEAEETLVFEVGDQERMVLLGRVGDIRVTGDPNAKAIRAEVRKCGRGTSPGQAEKALTEIEVSLGARAGDAQVIEARTKHPNSKFTRDYEVEWVVTVPPRLHVSVKSGVGDITLSELSGGAVVDSGVGDVRVQHTSGGARIETGVGDVHASGVDGGLTVRSGVGDIHADGVRGGATMRTGTGDAHVRGVAGGAEVRTGTGDVRLDVTQVGEENVGAHSGTGSVHVTVPRAVRGKLSARAGVGDLTIRLGDTPMTEAKLSRQEVECKLNGADAPTLNITSGVGDCTVRVQ